MLDLRPGEGALWDNRFRIELGTGAGMAVTVRALGDAGLQDLRQREALPPVPRIAARTLPACWRGETLLGLPDFGQALTFDAAPSLRHEGGLDCRATFLRGAI